MGDADHGALSHRRRFAAGLHFRASRRGSRLPPPRPGETSNVLSYPYAPLTESDLKIIRGAARRLLGRLKQFGLTRNEIEQELTLHVLRRLPAFDPALGRRCAFVKTAVERFANTLARDRCAAKRNHVAVSLSQTLDHSAAAIDLAQAVGQAELDARRQSHPRDQAELAQLVMDVQSVLGSLPSDLRRLADLLQTKCLAEAARELNVARSTLQHSVTRIRQIFEEAGLKEYL